MGSSKLKSTEKQKQDSHKTPINDKEDSMKEKKEKKEKDLIDPLGILTEEEKAMGFPESFTSSKGKCIQKNPVNAIRIGQVRKYQQYSRKRLKSWQIKKLRKKVIEAKSSQ